MAELQRCPVPSSWQNLNSSVSGIRGKIFPLKEKPPLMLSNSVSCKDLRSLSDEKDDREISDESQLVAADEEDCTTQCADAETENLEASSSEASENRPPQGRRFFGLLKQRSFRRQPTIPPVSATTLTRKSRSVKERSITSPSHGRTDPEYLCLMKPSWKNFSLAELRAATNNFSSKNIIGKGGYAEVYKGQLENGQFVAIKRLTRGTTEEMTQDFLSELGIIVHVNHPNAAKLIGFGVEEGMHLVLQLSSHGCLAELLTGAKEKLDWNTRYKIALGTAESLYYLHERCPRRIIHRDIKAANILLTDDFEPQICDFGLAKWLPDQWTHHTVSKFEGTFGYLAPEYLLHGTFDEKTDVYAYGVVLLELITGRPAIDSSQKSLVMWAQPLLESCEIMQLVDPSLGGTFNPQEMNSVIVAASACIRQSSLSRPPMKQVMELLRGVGDFNSITSSDTECSEDSTDAGESNPTRHFNDLTQLTQVAPEF